MEYTVSEAGSIQSIMDPLKALLIDYSNIIRNGCHTKGFFTVVIYTMLSILFIFGIQLDFLSSMITLCLLIPLLSDNLRTFLLQLETNDPFTRFFLDISDSLTKTPEFAITTGYMASILLSLFVRKTPALILYLFFFIYYLKTIYPISSILDLKLESFICCVIYFFLACFIQYSFTFRSLLATLLFALISTAGLIVLVYDLDPVETERIMSKSISLNTSLGDFKVALFRVLVAISLCSQRFVIYLSTKLKKIKGSIIFCR